MAQASRLDNPFLARERWQFARRRPIAWRWLGATLGLMTFVLLCAVLLRARMDEGGTLWLLVAPHAGLCILAAGYGASRIFWAENQIGTLEGALLLPYSPLRWLGLKSSFAFALLLFAWLPGVPIYAIAAVSGVISARTMLDAPFLPLVFGAATVPLTVLSTPQFLPRSERATAHVARMQAAGVEATPLNGDGWVLSLIGGVILLMLSLNGLGALSQQMWFFAVAVPLWVLLLVFLLLLSASVLATGMALVMGRDRDELFASIVRRVTLFYCVLTVVGIVWLGLALWGKMVALCVLASVPVSLLISTTVAKENAQAVPNQGRSAKAKASEAVVSEPRSPKQEREHAQASRETAWLLSRYDNAVWNKDVRSHLRASSLRSRTLGALTSVLLASVFFYALYRMSPGNGGYTHFVVFVLMSLFTPGSLAMTRWNLEAKGCTLMLLLMSPMSSRDIIVGRLRAAFTVGVLHAAPFLVAGALALLWLTGLSVVVERWRWVAFAAWLSVVALLPLIAVGNLVSAGNAHRALPSLQKPDGYPSSVGFAVAASVLALSCGLLFVGAYYGGIALLLAFGWSLAVCAIGVALCKTLFELRVQQLDALRRGDFAFDALRSHALTEPKASKGGLKEPV